jgi:hypothetical protein
MWRLVNATRSRVETSSDSIVKEPRANRFQDGIAWLDPRIHRLLQKTFFARSMGCRVKPGNDAAEFFPCTSPCADFVF